LSDATAAAQLLASLRSQSARFPTEMREIEVSLAAQEFKRAFALMSRLKERGVWQPAADAEAALEDFWWDYGQ
jgi:predicted translin family RNA/ssDNA-binding protein